MDRLRYGIPKRRLDWSTTATLLVFDVNDPPSSVLFASHYRVECPPGRQRCDSDLGAFANEFNVQLAVIPDPTTGIRVRIAMVPEPGTVVLVIAGLLGLAGWRRHQH